MIIHGCHNNTNTSYVNLYRNAGVCVSPIGTSTANCVTIGFIWAVGSGPLEMPPGVGVRIGTQTPYAFSQIVIEFHYTNPNYISGVVDNSGVRITMTPTPRSIDSGVLTLGDPVVTFGTIAPGLSAYSVEASCPSSCTSKWTNPIHVFGDLLHMHAAGTRMITNQFSSAGTMLRTTNRVEYYSYAFQQLTPVNFTVNPGDRFNTHCTYNTVGRTNTTKFGTGSLDEMCMDFLFYYPILYLPSTNATMTMCGHVRAGLAGDITVCGNANLQTSILAVANPSPIDPLTQYPVFFGNVTAPVCTVAVVKGASTNIVSLLAFALIAITLFI